MTSTENEFIGVFHIKFHPPVAALCAILAALTLGTVLSTRSTVDLATGQPRKDERVVSPGPTVAQVSHKINWSSPGD